MIHFAKFEQKNVANIYKPTPYLNQWKFHYAGIIFKPNGSGLSCCEALG